MMKLWHVSEASDIAIFEPRVPSNAAARVTVPVVWAVGDAHLVNYLFPRDCPRIAVRRSATTSAADAAQFLGPGTPNVVLFIEAPWFDAAHEPVWIYALPPATFECVDANAGYFVSSETVAPIERLKIESPLNELLVRGAELRVVPRLRPVAEAVAASSLSFSIIRLRNALG